MIYKCASTVKLEGRQLLHDATPKMPLKSPKRYLRGSTDDGDEESATLKLFRDVTVSSEGRYDSNASMRPPDVTGIRLVRRNGIGEYF